MIPHVTRDDIADIWIAVAAARLERGDKDGSFKAFKSSRIIREGCPEAQGLREHNSYARHGRHP